MTRLRQRMIEDMQVRNLAQNTQTSYLLQVSAFARHFGKSPEALGFDHVRDYQLHLVREKKLAPNSVTVAVSALRFLYKCTLHKDWDFDQVLPSPQKPKSLPVVLSPEEVEAFLASVEHRRDRTILTVCYAAGLRISEAVHLKVSDIDSARMVIRVDQGKGARDRYVMLSPKLLELLRDWYRHCRPTDWLFPGRPGHPINVHTVQMACVRARQKCGCSKLVSPHSLRHAFAVHLLESGTDVRTIQLLLGHRGLATTAQYLRIASSKVCAVTSPLDRLPSFDVSRTAR